MATPNVTLNPTYDEIQALLVTIQGKIQVLSDEKRSLREAYTALNNVQYQSRTVETTPFVPAVLSDDGSGTVTAPEVPAKTEQVYDVLPSMTNIPDESMTQELIKNAYDYWNDIINPNVS